MWDFFEAREGRWYRWSLQGAEVWLGRSGDEWRLGSDSLRFAELREEARGPEEAAGPPELPILIAAARGSRAALRPAMPPLPCLITARNEVRITPGEEVVFLADLPVSLRVELEGGTSLGEWSPFTLSRAWFGDRAEGELCLSLPMALDPFCRGEAAKGEKEPLPSLVRTEIRLRNDTRSSVDLDLLAVHAELLPVYLEGGRLRSDRVAMDVLPDGSLRTSIQRDPTLAGAALLSPPRLGQSELLVRRGVNFLRSIAGLQGVSR